MLLGCDYSETKLLFFHEAKLNSKCYRRYLRLEIRVHALLSTLNFTALENSQSFIRIFCKQFADLTFQSNVTSDKVENLWSRKWWILDMIITNQPILKLCPCSWLRGKKLSKGGRLTFANLKALLNYKVFR